MDICAIASVERSNRQTLITDCYTIATALVPETVTHSVEHYGAIGDTFGKVTAIDGIRHQIYAHLDFKSMQQFGATSRKIHGDPVRIAIVDEQIQVRRQHQGEMDWEEYIESGGYAADEALMHEIGYY
jgi:hypothetical protein